MGAGTSDVELRHLAAFLAVYEHRSFGRAATALGYSQAAVSQQIGALEKGLGVHLFVRPGGPRPVEPTESADQLLPHARAVFRELGLARAALDAVAEGRRGRLSVGSFESVSVALLPTIVARLTNERPDIELRLTEHHSDRFLCDLLVEGELDAAFLPDAPTMSGVAGRELLVDPYVAVVHGSFERDTITIAELGEQPLVGHTDDDSCQMRVNVALHAHGFTPRYVFRSSDNGALQAMVRSGLGVAVMPQLAVDTTDPGVRVIAIEPAIPARHVHLSWYADRPPSPVLAKFIELVDEVVAEIAPARVDVSGVDVDGVGVGGGGAEAAVSVPAVEAGSWPAAPAQPAGRRP